MKIFDAHCDVLYKLWGNEHLSFYNDKDLHVTYEQLQMTGAKVQCFAIFVPNDVPYGAKFQAALKMVDLFYSRVINPYDQMVHIQTRQDLLNLKEDEIGAILSLEGVDAIEGNVLYYKTLLRLGVRSVGLTWNDANLAADGILEERGAGLTSFGKELVELNNEYHIWTDVSHLSERACWQVLELAKKPLATHSNVKSLCNHPRNLTNEQIKMLIQQNGRIGLTFVPQFLRNDENASISDLLRHLDFVCRLGGEDYVGFGSDFDGIDVMTKGLENYRCYENLINQLLNYYTVNQVNKFLFENLASDFLS
ncbi:dipeptidase [Bacillus solimangrovi]|uniref:Diguanylate cyclase n=1 Tax=Bacillus solimangrovi TaxID=1305675 RepID=A0A1E5LJ62_9BACI|nr:dipeptidase [Bacillus solimangrovi]OEH94132.1 diguanylate cyclase [Bacillus solimangrovi]